MYKFSLWKKRIFTVYGYPTVYFEHLKIIFHLQCIKFNILTEMSTKFWQLYASIHCRYCATFIYLLGYVMPTEIFRISDWKTKSKIGMVKYIDVR